MERLSFGEDNEISEANLDKRISEAFNAALTNDEYEQKLAEFKVLCKQRETGLDPEAELKCQTLQKQLDDCEITVASVMEYKKLLEMVPTPKEKIDAILSHENAHANVAEQVPSRSFTGFTVRFYRDEEGKVSILPSVYSEEDVSFPEKQRLEERILVSEAPLSYDNDARLSPRDEENIADAKSRLSEIS